MENFPEYSEASFIPILQKSSDQPSTSKQGTVKKKSGKQQSPTFSQCPWRKKTNYSCGVIGFHEEINEFFDMMSPTAEESEIRLKVVEHITKVIHSLWPQANVDVFGSFRTGLYLPSSDIDMVVVGGWKCLPLSTLSEALKENGIGDDDVHIIPNASVPIVRVLHTPSRIRVDISFNTTNGVQTSKLIKKLMKQYPPLPKLVLVLKQFLIHRGLNEVYTGGMSSYCLTLLIVSFLQGFHKPKSQPSTNLGTLLMEFFEHYGINFNYEKVSIHFDNGGNYQPKFRDTGPYLSVEDPLIAGKDIARGTYLMHTLKLAFQNAFHILHRNVLESMKKQMPLFSYLELILRVEESVLTKRQWLHDNYSTILRSVSRLIRDTSEFNDFSTPNKEKKRRKSSLNSTFQDTYSLCTTRKKSLCPTFSLSVPSPIRVIQPSKE